MNKNDYVRIRNSAWKFLIKNNVSSLPLDIVSILKNNNIKFSKYQNALTKQFLSEQNLWHLTKTDIGIIAKIGSQFYIFYDDEQKTLGRKRFTLAHEIGHAYLGHTIAGQTSFGRSMIYKSFKLQHETEADMFAARILAPLCVLKELNIKTIDGLISLTGLSREAAGYRLKRLQKIMPRNKFYNEYSGLETQVFKQFEKFIKTNQSR